ncbi:MAG: TonB-dependent receptor [Porticoccaceae bacterium]|nr:MAG: TonB-dependent receptor [Porticoccaceae bacterium]
MNPNPQFSKACFQHPALKRPRALRQCIALALPAFLLGGAPQLRAGDEAERQPLLEEIIVTGTKREEAVQTLPFSVSVLKEDAFLDSPFNDIRALASKTPGLVLSNPTGFNAAGGGMRGTGTNIILVTQDAPVSFLVDEFALSHVTSQFLNLFDIDQIEVYRGPQGTLFGKNSTGGVISIKTKKPELGRRSFEFDATYGEWDNVSDGNYQSLKFAVNYPLGESAAFRLAAIYDKDDGFYRNFKDTATFPEVVPLWQLFGIPPGTPLPDDVEVVTNGDGSNLGGKDVLALKGKILWNPLESLQIHYTYEYVDDDSDSPPGVNENFPTDLVSLLGFPGINDVYPRPDPYNTLITGNKIIGMQNGHQVNIHGNYLNLDYDAGDYLFKSITGYRSEEQSFPSTYTGEAFTTLFDSVRTTNRDTLQQEFRIVSQYDGPFNFVAGASYFKDEFDFNAFFSVGIISLIPEFNAETGSFLDPEGRVNLDTRALHDYQLQGTKQDREEYGLYFDGTYALTERWDVSAGIRFTHDKKDFLRGVDGGAPCNQYTEEKDKVFVDGQCLDTRSQYISRAGLRPDQFDGDIPFSWDQFGTRVEADKVWREVTYRLATNYQLDEARSVYLTYSTGFLSGGFSETCATVERCAYDPEKAANVELGLKGDFLDASLRVNAALYYTVYEDLQRAAVATYTAADGSPQQETVTVNTGKSELWGFDFETVWMPTANLNLTAAVNLMDHEYKSAVLPDLRGTNQPVDLTKYDIPFSPDLKLLLGATYEIPLQRYAVVLGANVNYQDETETDVFNAPRTQMEERTLVDLSAALVNREEGWQVVAYVNNALNERKRVSALPVAGLFNFTQYSPPRAFGLRFNYKFSAD